MSVPYHDPWFDAEVLPHERDLRAWLQARFPALADVDDLVQETYVRILGVRDRASIDRPRAFLFSTARNLALDHARRRQIVTMESMAEPERLFADDGKPSAADAAALDQELELLTQAIQTLPERCRQVLTLRKIYGLSQREIAAQLRISEHIDGVRVGNGLRRCAEFFARHALP